jgi:hypothetical protein
MVLSLQLQGRNSLGLDPELPDDRPPFLDIGFHQCCKGLRCLALAWKNVLPKIGEPRSHYRIGERLHSRGAELADDLLRRIPGTKSPNQNDMESAGRPISRNVGIGRCRSLPDNLKSPL